MSAWESLTSCQVISECLPKQAFLLLPLAVKHPLVRSNSRLENNIRAILKLENIPGELSEDNICAALSSTAHRCFALFDRLRGPRLSETREKWRVAGYFGLAVVVHFAAVALAFLHFEQPIETIGFAGTIETSVEMTLALEESTVPPDLEPPALPPTPPEEYLFPRRSRLRLGSANVTKPIVKPRRGAADHRMHPRPERSL